MRRRLIHLTCSVVVLGLALANPVNAELVAYWPFEEGSGNVVYDLSDYANDGAINGAPKWVVGKMGAALEFDGSDDYVDCGNDPSLDINDKITVMAWVKTTSTAHGYFVSKGTAWDEIGHYAVGQEYNVPMTFQLEIAGSGGTVELDSNVAVNDGQWHHIVGVYDDPVAKVYVDGVEEGTTTQSNRLTGSAVEGLTIGRRGGGNIISGIIDEVRIYNRALTEPEILTAMEGAKDFPLALGPDPADSAIHEATWVSLKWKAGDFAVSHDVYLSDNFDDANDGADDAFRGNQIATDFIIGFPGFPFPEGLVPGTTYYWRIDEVNEADPNSPWKGDIWSFSVPPKTAYNPDPPDGAEFVEPDATFSWAGGFGAKLHTVYIGNNFDDVNDAVGGAPLGVSTFAPGPLEPEKVYFWRVDEFDPPFTHKGDVWSFTTPGAVGNPQPANGAADVQMIATLSWTSADNAASHELYLGTDADAVKNATTASPEYIGPRALGAESYDPGGLAWDSGYAWRVDEVYATGTVKGPVWSFTTAGFLLVDDFESYNDIDPPDPASNRIFEAWPDGFLTPTTNGAIVGNDLPPYAEQTIVHGGGQSMPYRYDNNLKTSEATLTLVYPRDWTEQGVAKLSLWFRADSGNVADRMFVALNGNAVVYHDDASATQIAGWNQWIIDLGEFAGVDLTNVNTITIGFGTKGSPAAGGAGTMYFDDIRLAR